MVRVIISTSGQEKEEQDVQRKGTLKTLRSLDESQTDHASLEEPEEEWEETHVGNSVVN